MSAKPQQPAFQAHPLAVLAAAFAAGAIAARYAPLPLKLAVICCAACSLAAACFFAKKFSTRAAVAALILAFCFAGMTLAVVERESVTHERVRRLYDDGLIGSGDPVELTGVLEGEPEPAPDGFYLTLRAEGLRFKEQERKVSGRVSLFAPVRGSATRAEYGALELRHGARVRLMAALKREENFRNPGVSPFTEFLDRREIDATALIKSPLLVERLDDERVFLPLVWLYEWRQRMLALIDGKFSRDTGGVLKAALLGSRQQLSRATAERFREGGTFHVLVISGLHISFIGGVILLLMRRVTKRRAVQFAASALALWAYAIMVGAEVSVSRAALMFTVVALAPVLHRRAKALNALGCATLILLVRRPQDLFDPSFQLTFLSVLAIVVVAWPLLERFRNVGAWRPTRETPRPPACPRPLRLFCETLFWSEREWKREVARSNYAYRLFKTPLAARLEKLHLQRVLRYAFAAVVVSASVQLFLLPLLILYFHRLSLAALVLNIVVGALLAALSLAALAALLISQLSPTLAAPLFKLAEGLSWLTTHSVDPFARAGLASVRLPEYAGWPSAVYILYYVPLLALAAALARWDPFAPPEADDDERARLATFVRTKVAAAALAALLFIIVAHPFSAARPDGRLRVDFLDVGQGDSALVTMPDGTTLLVDGGGRPSMGRVGRGPSEDFAAEAFERDARSIGESVVSEYLWWRGLDHVDYLLATHADADHMDGLNDVARSFRVRAALVGRAPASDPEFAKFAATTRAGGVPLRIIGRGDVLRFGEVEAEVLWPARTENAFAPSRNDDSVVLRIRFGRRVFLLTGDAEKGAEAALAGARDDLRCDVLKVAHHGSRTSSTAVFLRAALPAYAVISVGLSSPFGHPHKEVMERLRAAGAQVLTTGRSGTITISTNGDDLKVETYIK